MTKGKPNKLSMNHNLQKSELHVTSTKLQGNIQVTSRDLSGCQFSKFYSTIYGNSTKLQGNIQITSRDFSGCQFSKFQGLVVSKHGLYVGGLSLIPTAFTTRTAAGGNAEHVFLNH